MERNDQAAEHNRQAEKGFRHIDDTYIFDPSSGIYQPKSYAERNQIHKENSQEVHQHTHLAPTGGNGASWLQALFTALGVMVSIITAGLLLLTIIFAKKQWSEMHQATIQSIRSADAAASAAQTSSDILRNSRREAEIENRPILWVTKDLGAPQIEPSSGLAWEWHITNYGRTPALDVEVEQQAVINKNAYKCWRVVGPIPSKYGNFNFPAPIAPSKEESGICLFPPSSYGANLSSEKWAKENFHNKGTAQVRITLRYRDVYKAIHVTSICIQNAGFPTVPETKGEYCESPKSQID